MYDWDLSWFISPFLDTIIFLMSSRGCIGSSINQQEGD